MLIVNINLFILPSATVKLRCSNNACADIRVHRQLFYPPVDGGNVKGKCLRKPLSLQSLVHVCSLHFTSLGLVTKQYIRDFYIKCLYAKLCKLFLIGYLVFAQLTTHSY